MLTVAPQQCFICRSALLEVYSHAIKDKLAKVFLLRILASIHKEREEHHNLGWRHLQKCPTFKSLLYTTLLLQKMLKKTKTKTPKQKWRWAFIYWFSSEPLQRQHSPPAGEVAPPSPLQEPHSAPVHQAPAALTCACEPLCSRPVYSVHSLPRRVLRELLLCCCHFGSQKASKKTLLSDNRENVYTIACPYMIY